MREALLVCVIFAWIGSVFALFPSPASPKYPTWPDGVLLGCALLSALFSLAYHVPWQNVAVVVGILLVLAWGAFGGFAAGLFPEARLIFADRLGPVLPGGIPAAVLPLWVVVILTSRGMARLILQPWRGGGRYGWWLMGVTALLAVVLAGGLEVAAANVKQYWQWRLPAWRGNWNGILWPALALWFIAALLAQVLGLPWLVSKRPVAPPPDLHPLIVWFLVSLWMLAATSTRGLLQEAGLILGITLLTTTLAVRGGMLTGARPQLRPG